MESWQGFFGAELDRLRHFYSIEVSEEEVKEAEQWLRDNLELRSNDQLEDRLKALSPCDARQLRYDFVQFVKRNRRIKSNLTHNRAPVIGTAHPFDEKEERDSRLE
jgi:hypothetical protein